MKKQFKKCLGRTLVKCSRIYTGQYTFPILLSNDDNMLGEHKGREKNIVYGRLFWKIHILYFDRGKTWIWRTLGHARNIFTKWHFHNAWIDNFFVKNFFQFHALVQKYHVVAQYCQIGNFQSGTFATMHGIEKSV